MSVDKSGAGNMALRCDQCKRLFHPRGSHKDAESLRRRSVTRGWTTVGENDFCSPGCLSIFEAPRAVDVLGADHPVFSQVSRHLFEQLLGRSIVGALEQRGISIEEKNADGFNISFEVEEKDGGGFRLILDVSTKPPPPPGERH